MSAKFITLHFGNGNREEIVSLDCGFSSLVVKLSNLSLWVQFSSFKILRGKNQHKSPSRVFVPSFCYNCNLALYFSNRMCRQPLVGRLTPVCISCYLPVSPCPPAFTMHPQPSFTFTTNSVNTKLYSASMPLTLACQVLN